MIKNSQPFGEKISEISQGVWLTLYLHGKEALSDDGVSVTYLSVCLSSASRYCIRLCGRRLAVNRSLAIDVRGLLNDYFWTLIHMHFWPTDVQLMNLHRNVADANAAICRSGFSRLQVQLIESGPLVRIQTRKPCCRRESARCRCNFRSIDQDIINKDQWRTDFKLSYVTYLLNL